MDGMDKQVSDLTVLEFTQLVVKIVSDVVNEREADVPKVEAAESSDEVTLAKIAAIRAI